MVNYEDYEENERKIQAELDSLILKKKLLQKKLRKNLLAKKRCREKTFLTCLKKLGFDVENEDDFYTIIGIFCWYKSLDKKSKNFMTMQQIIELEKIKINEMLKNNC